MKATLRLQGLTKEDQLVSMVRYSPLRAHILKGAYSNGCPANWKTEQRSNVVPMFNILFHTRGEKAKGVKKTTEPRCSRAHSEND